MYIAEISDFCEFYPKSFIALDFETATPSRMACQLGIVEVIDGKIIYEKEYMIQPPSNYYDHYCVQIHKITPDMTEDAPTFDQIWPEVRERLRNKAIVAHNAAFDRDVLIKNVWEYELQAVKIKRWICTYKDLSKVPLDRACEYFNIPLDNHHDSLADARATALLYLNYIKMYGQRLEIPQYPGEKFGKLLNIKTIKQSESTNATTFFKNKRVVMTGVFDAFPARTELAQVLTNLGAKMNSSISGLTDITVVGHKAGPSKLQKIVDINNSGGNIRIIEEAELLEILSDIKCGE